MFIGYIVQAQKTAPEILEFLNSADFARFLSGSQFAANGEIDLERSFVEYEEKENQRIPVITISFSGPSDNRTRTSVGQIQAIKVRSDFNGLPGGARYLQVYRDFRNFDFNSETGIINVHDLNYGEYLCTQATVNRSSVVQLSAYQMPPEIAERYGTGIPASPVYHQCDLNNNGNVTFGECFTCLTNSCNASPACQLLCMLLNQIVKRVCLTSTIANCVYMSIAY